MDFAFDFDFDFDFRGAWYGCCGAHLCSSGIIYLHFDFDFDFDVDFDYIGA